MTGSKSICCFCRLPKADVKCECCGADVCKKCQQRMPPDALSLLSNRAEELRHDRYCPGCYANHVEPALAGYEELLDKARNLHFWTKSYRGNLPILRKARAQLSLSSGRDKDAIVLALAFRTVELGFNGLIDVEIKSKKVRENEYQRMEWSAVGLPVEIDLERLEAIEAKYGFE